MPLRWYCWNLLNKNLKNTERYKATLVYDGTLFSGFQRQAEVRTVQGEVEAALRNIGWDGTSILAAGRTDTGVHASGQVVAFDLKWVHSASALQNALNANLPPDVAAQNLQFVDPGFHPRYDAVTRKYQYCILCQAVRNPLRERFVWRVWPPLDLAHLQQAARQFPGTHDFAAFGTPFQPDGATVRTVCQASWLRREEDFVFEIEAKAFLYHMIRRIVNLQIAIGHGKMAPEIVSQYFAGGMTSPIQGLAPPQGLVLAEVRYPAAGGEIFKIRKENLRSDI